ncbi:MAG: hypothetical protein HY926_03970 [Elusimicrobia bacterium]|nr:hypothetical protein [Elusimicrobiota bacterium]
MRTACLRAALAVLCLTAPASGADYCRPWLVESSLDWGSVSVSLTLGNACSPQNEGSYFMEYRTRGAGGRQDFAFKSSDYPEQQAALDSALKSMALLGATDKDIDTLDQAVMPLAAADRIGEASARWRDYLLIRVPAAR